MATTKKTRKAKKTDKKTYVALVIDRSGSMSSIHKQTVDGINEQFGVLRRNAELAGDTEITLFQFDDVIETVFKDVAPTELKNWELSDFVPRGSTAMYDAVWAAINHLKSKPLGEDTAFLVCVISDGHENASREVNQGILSEEIKRLQDTGDWTFSYMLANQDIHQVSHALNVPVSNIAAFNSTLDGSSVAYTANASSTANYLSMRSVGVKSVSNFYDDDLKKKLAETR
jgi:uncharacterized protein YegL